MRNKINAMCFMVYTVIVMCTGCTSEEMEELQSDKDGIDTQQAAVQDVSAREILEEKLHQDMSGVILQPDNTAQIKSRTVPEVNLNAFLDSISQVSSMQVEQSFHAADGNWEEGETRNHVVRTESHRGFFDVHVKEGVYEESVADRPDNLPDDYFMSKTGVMLSEMGVHAEESDSHEVWRLMRASRPTKINGELLDPTLEDKVTVSPVMKKVTFYREVGGIPVLGNRLTFSFTLDGEFLSISGRWTSVDYAASQVSSDLSMTEFRDRMLDRVAAMGLESGKIENIYLRTFYKTEENATGKQVLNLYGNAILAIEDASGTGRKIDVSLDI